MGNVYIAHDLDAKSAAFNERWRRADSPTPFPLEEFEAATRSPSPSRTSAAFDDRFLEVIA